MENSGKMRRVLFALVSLVTAIASADNAESETSYTRRVEGVCWTFVSATGEAIVGGHVDGRTAVPSDFAGDVVIPSELGEYAVVGIGEYAFAGCRKITGVVIPNGVTSIESHAFWGCDSLASMPIMPGVKNIGDSAFSSCTGLVSVVVPCGVTNVGAHAFEECLNLAEVAIPASVCRIGPYAFATCDKLTKILVDEHNQTFRSVDGVVFSSDMKQLCFYPGGRQGKYAIPNGVETIGEGAFNTCDLISGVEFPLSVRTIGYGAFCWCEGLTQITIPANVEVVGDWAFATCCGIESVVIEDGVRHIGNYAFKKCESLKEITIPPSVTNIGSAAFEQCRSVAAVNLSCGVKHIGEAAITSSTNLIAVTVPSSVDSVGERIFVGCTELREVLFEGLPPAGMTINMLGCNQARLFYRSAYEKEWKAALLECGITNAEPYDVLGDGEHSRVVGGIDWRFSVKNGKLTILNGVQVGPAGRELEGRVVVPSEICGGTVVGIGEDAFRDCGWIKCVTIPSSVTSIGKNAFAGCSELTSVQLGDTMPWIDANAFGSRADGDPTELTVHTTANPLKCAYVAGVPLVFDNYGEEPPKMEMTLVVTNIVVHYIMTSELSPMAAPVTKDVGLVNVIADIEGGSFVVPDSWADNYPDFVKRFGSDFSVALMCHTGKFDAAGNEMKVWQDFVAGTDPTDTNSVFRASILMVEGKPVVSYSPILSESEAAKRTYTIWGKKKLQDESWVQIPSGSENDYNFFKVSVKMK